MQNEQALVPMTSLAKRSNGNSTEREATSSANAAPLTDELVSGILAGRGLRGWLRAARVARVLGLFTLYLFLDTYHIRADFNQRMAERLRAEATKNVQGWPPPTRELLVAQENTIKLVRCEPVYNFTVREARSTYNFAFYAEPNEHKQARPPTAA